MTLKTLITTVVVGAALVGVQAGWGMSDASDRGPQPVAPDAFERAVAAAQQSSSWTGRYRDAFERAVVAGQQDTSALAGYRDAFERAVAQRPTHVPVRGHVDRYELDLPRSPVASTATGSGRELEWPQLGIGFGLGILSAFGLVLAARLTRFRPLTH